MTYMEKITAFVHNEELNDLYCLMICTAHQIFGLSYQEKCDGRGMKRVFGRGEVHIGFWWGNLRERDHLEDPGLDRRIILRWISGSGLGALAGLIWLRIGVGGGFL
jgi:hypothetical protein